MPMKKSGMWRNKNSSTSKKATPYRNKGVTEVGKEAKTQSYKEYVQKMFGGGMTQTKKMYRGGNVARMPTTGPSTISLRPTPSRPIDPVLPRGKRGKGPGI